MKVFISWSGALSQQVASLLGTWIGDVLQGTETWISTDDIDKGSLWFGDISTQLSETGVGILCLTRENVTAPWVLFEAGALSKGLSKSRVCPLLVNLSHTDLKPPLSQFNGTLPTKEDMLKLIRTINSQNAKPIADDKVQKAFDRWWDDFESRFAAILKGYKPAKEGHKRPPEDLLEEILEITRSLQKASQQSPKVIFVRDSGNPVLDPQFPTVSPDLSAIIKSDPQKAQVAAEEVRKLLSMFLSPTKAGGKQEKTPPRKGE